MKLNYKEIEEYYLNLIMELRKEYRSSAPGSDKRREFAHRLFGIDDEIRYPILSNSDIHNLCSKYANTEFPIEPEIIKYIEARIYGCN